MRVLVLGWLVLSGCTTDGDKDGLPSDEDCDDASSQIGGPTAWYPDEDGDGIGADAGSVTECAAPAGYVGGAGDCDDGDPTVRPGVAEACDGQDDDCDGEIDEEAPGALWYADADGDGYGNPAQAQDLCVPEAGLVGDGSDCNDVDGNTWPGADELCDGVDNDCDGLVDDQAAGSAPYWPDDDGDGFGAGTPVTSCVAPSGYADSDSDCDDGANGVHPGADETCNGVDDDCDGTLDDDPVDGTAWYVDADGDAYGVDASVVVSCSRLDGTAERGGDCDDTDPEQNPETWWYSDSDGDGWGDASGKAVQQCLGFAGSSRDDGDCDDADASRSPDALETCDGVDEDCDGLIDDDAGEATAWYADADGDGFGNDDIVVTTCDTLGAGFVLLGGDCDDAEAAANPDATERCDDVDNDCDGLVDDADPSLVEIPVWYLDNDSDGYGTFGTSVETCDPPLGYVLDGSDCEDENALIHAYQTEVCNGIDDDCDLRVDGADAIDATAWYVDGDADGWGDPATETWSCEVLPDEIDRGEDCDDTDGSVHPLAEEDCADARDLNCDGSFGDADADGDGWVACDDCDDGEARSFPGAAEVCDEADNDCNGLTDDDGSGGYPWRHFLDDDADGYGLTWDWITWCDPGLPAGYAPDGGDCDNADAGVYPGAFEACDLRDTDCDGVIPAAEVDTDHDGETPSSCGGTDCDDSDPTVSSVGVEVCGDGIDADCDGVDLGCRYTFSGVLTNVDASVLVGWTECYSDDFADSEPIMGVLSLCDKADLAIGCRQSGTTVLTAVAHAPRADVTFETGTGNVLHYANGVGWYYNGSWSWGFVDDADTVSRNSCDTGVGSYPEHRVCFHTSGNQLSGGYRCGTTTGLNTSRLWERVFFHSDP